ncbi:c-type cytochrome [Variovorax sp. J22R115]|nr:c-type cytochrome [Variovorax sp. J22R115]MDM0052775.1 c-type cytochrome [Variovorax sp. J22R115]
MGLRLARAVATALLLCPAAGFAASEAQALSQDYGCISCHGLVRKQVGPGFAQIAARYRNDPSAPAQLATRIRNGSVGSWGRVIMPRQFKVTDSDAKALAEWVLSQPSPP